MNFDFTAEAPKLMMLLYGVIAFAAVVGLLLLVLDVLPARKDRWIALGLLAPAGLLLLVGLVVPAIRTMVLAFMNADSSEFVGLENFRWMFTDKNSGMLPDFSTTPVQYGVLLSTLLWVLLVPTVSTAVGLVYAVMVDRSRFESFAKSLVFMPMAISFVGAGIIWKFVYEYRQEGADQIGLLNQIVVWFGGTPQQWLLDGPWNTLFLIVVLVWIQAGFAMVVLSAAIKAIPADIVEAAHIDGVTPWQMFWRVTIPSIRPALVVVLVTISIGTLKVFDIVRTMTGGQFGTSVVANEMYTYSFRADEKGKGAALAVLLFLFVIPIVIYQVRLMRRRRLEGAR
ncbi:alpha-glucoside ABC transporter permease [Catellatospora methionotrophica]|uniref:Alpha-glucoside ABC transporter permease n=1 Tax=Catellatospora methionotrophica TaxID=121620 RepID=A0A8J3PII8_9ACTN|nr:sugar ABC transporter permease [Catellatospora methionotrophica]GIG17463.1 alpha-glucoside ABC transporter permease [Catellatospora methionotrophica]